MEALWLWHYVRVSCLNMTRMQRRLDKCAQNQTWVPANDSGSGSDNVVHDNDMELDGYLASSSKALSAPIKRRSDIAAKSNAQGSASSNSAVLGRQGQ